ANEAVGNDLHHAEVTLERGNGGRHLLVFHGEELGRGTTRNAREGRTLLRTRHQDRRVAALSEGILLGSRHHRERERALSTVRRSGRSRAVGTTDATIDVGGEPPAQRPKLRRRRRVAGDRGLVRAEDKLLVPLQLVPLLAHLIDDLAIATRLVDRILRARNDDFLAGNLRPVADANGG